MSLPTVPVRAYTVNGVCRIAQAHDEPKCVRQEHRRSCVQFTAVEVCGHCVSSTSWQANGFGEL